MHIAIELPGGRRLKIDEADRAIYESRKWFCCVRKTKGREYVYVESGSHSTPRVLFHRVLMGAVTGQVVDHIDGDGLNNTRENMRVCTHAENMRNRRINVGNSTGFKGVGKRGTSYYAEIRAGEVRRRKRGFATAEAAAACYAAWAVELHGDFAQFSAA